MDKWQQFMRLLKERGETLGGLATKAKVARPHIGGILRRENGRGKHSLKHILPHLTIHEAKTLELVRPIAHHTGDGWLLQVRSCDDEEEIYPEEGLPWPEDWPESVNTDFLEGKGFEIIP